MRCSLGAGAEEDGMGRGGLEGWETQEGLWGGSSASFPILGMLLPSQAPSKVA